MHNDMPEPFMLPARHAYAADAFKFDVETTTMDMLANTFMRAPGESVGTFGLECGIDELAIELGMDPIELRIMQRAREGSDERRAVLVAPHRRRLARGRRALRLERSTDDARHAAATASG